MSRFLRQGAARLLLTLLLVATVYAAGIQRGAVRLDADAMPLPAAQQAAMAVAPAGPDASQGESAKRSCFRVLCIGFTDTAAPGIDHLSRGRIAHALSDAPRPDGQLAGVTTPPPRAGA